MKIKNLLNWLLTCWPLETQIHFEFQSKINFNLLQSSINFIGQLWQKGIIDRSLLLDFFSHLSINDGPVP